MPIRVFHVSARFTNDDEHAEMNSFLSGHRIVSVRKEFVADGQNSYWSFCVDYFASTTGKPDAAAPAAKKTQIDYRESLTPEDFLVFATLRALRKDIANRDGVPIYTIFTNQQLADLVTGRVTTKEAFRHVNGVGSSRIEKYGDAFLDSLTQHWNGQNETGEQAVSRNSGLG